MSATELHSEGVVLRIKARAGGRLNGITGIQNGRLRVSVTQIPERGKANQAILKLLAKQLGLRGSQLELIGGENASEKRFLVRGITPQEIDRRIEDKLAKLT